MGPIALFVVLVIMPVAALAVVLVGLGLLAVAGAASSVPAVSWLSFVAGLLLGALLLRIGRARRQVRRATVALRNER